MHMPEDLVHTFLARAKPPTKSMSVEGFEEGLFDTPTQIISVGVCGACVSESASTQFISVEAPPTQGVSVEGHEACPLFSTN